ncbi:MAG: hypothetical protein FIA95_09975 [Gemmatimonadetes bacterium]|nr:hypothetical protein [Gemmatimonadota bacterium]
MPQQPPRRPRAFPRRSPALGRLLPGIGALLVQAPALLGQATADGSPTQATEARSVALADSLLQAGDDTAAYEILDARLAAAPDDFEARWRAVRIALSRAVLGPSHGVRREWALRADAHGRELLRLRPDDPEALAWGAAARGRHALNEDGFGTVASLAKETWALTEALLAADPGHPLGNHVRGKLSQQVAGLPAAARLFGRLFLGSRLVSQGTWARAEEHHLKAVAGDPGMVFFYLDLADTYATQRKNAAAAEVYRSGLAVPSRFPADAEFKRLMAERLAALEGSREARLRYY